MDGNTDTTIDADGHAYTNTDADGRPHPTANPNPNGNRDSHTDGYITFGNSSYARANLYVA